MGINLHITRTTLDDGDKNFTALHIKINKIGAVYEKTQVRFHQSTISTSRQD
ncbi:hypothetical protein GCM10011282_29570 [Undibacterium macrobrachii]|uniref:Uncharacterized protein n=1 Tax=Undibacterium macrobrachii TaxID=1119058 RepID=A0ABQ2XKS6_9BURK|nr:hypothetical protein GCM10011282_29570 [Undibacterium macrobrachii]